MSFHSSQFRAASRGFTLVEFIIYIGLVGFILTAAIGFALDLVGTKAKSAALEETSRNARFAVSRIAADVREASDYNIGSSTLGVDPSTLSLAMANAGLDPTVFSVSNGVLNITQGAGATMALTSSKVQVTEFTVTDLSTAGRTKAFRIHLRLQYVRPTGMQMIASDYTFEDTVQIQKNDGFSN